MQIVYMSNYASFKFSFLWFRLHVFSNIWFRHRTLFPLESSTDVIHQWCCQGSSPTGYIAFWWVI